MILPRDLFWNLLNESHATCLNLAPCCRPSRSLPVTCSRGNLPICELQRKAYQVCYKSIRPYFFSCENLVDFNEVRLHEPTLNIHTHAWIVSRLSIASADGKQHLSETRFSALLGCSLLEKYPTLFFLLRKPGGFKWSALACGLWGNDFKSI